MQHLKLVKICVAIIFASLMLFGFSAHGISIRKGHFYNSYIIAMYALAIASAFTVSYGQSMLNDWQNDEFDLENVTNLYSYMNITSVIINYLTAFILSSTFVRFFNNVSLFETLRFFEVSARTVIVSVRLVILKALLIPVIYEVTFLLQQIRNEPDKHLLWTLYTVLPLVLAQMYPNLFFSALVIGKVLVETLNERLCEIVNEVNCMQTPLQMSLHKPYYRMQLFCDLADRMDLLAQKYDIICRQTTKYLQLLSAPVICSLLCNLCGITVGCFRQYLAVAETLVNNEPYDVFQALTNAAFLAISVIEVMLLAQISDNNVVKVQETGLILQRINLTHADLRFKQSVDAFSLLVLVTKYKIEPLGMLEINISLIQDVLSAVTSFLLIFVQSDLTLRFSLK
ncbi:putative gustatory receptor 94a isoform X2 [Bactrocera dorsalis]|uniref:Gustatory receptor n=1 Tax=Bactrocera dorsalis TaxID=27457 RepID=A0A6J0RP90_BACDO|nr:putative gustatory receptor 94a isoform X2 [Bactrocera dorsalis]